MKKVLSTGIVALAAMVMASCANNQQKSAAEAELELQRYKDSVKQAADTAGLAEYRAWKAQNELGEQEQAQEEANGPAAVAPVRSSANHSSSATARRSSASSSRSTASTGRSSSSGSSGSGGSSAPSTTQKKEGWSKAAKGAAIGGAGGAITGAVINKKNRAAGAVVGGVVGGVVGYGIGRSKDKKDGRY